MRVAALFTHPIQYFAPLLRTLAAQPGLDLTVYFGSRRGTIPLVDPNFGKAFTWDTPILDGYRHKFLPGVFPDDGRSSATRQVNPGIVAELTRQRYDVVWVHGYMVTTHQLAMLASLIRRIPVLLRGESHLRVNKHGPMKKHAKYAVLRALFGRFSGFLYIGSLNKEYYQHYGVPENRLFFCPYTVDNSFFRTQAQELAPNRRKIRSAWGIEDDRPVILYVGKLYSVKQPLLLLEGYRRVRERHPCALLIAGDGPMRSDVEAEINRKHIPDVRITGFMNQSEVSKAYAAGDLLVLTSRSERWGLAVNEAMNFGLPIVVSDRVGCGPDLVQPGVNGEVFEHQSTDALETILDRLLANPGRLAALGQASLERIQGWGLSQTAKGITDALSAVTARPV